MATKRIQDLQLRSDFDETVNLPADDATQTWRVTGAQILAFLKSQIPDLVKFKATTVGNFANISTETTVNPGTVIFDSDSGYNSSTGEWTAPRDGTYQITFSGRSGSGTAEREFSFYIQKNGTTLPDGSSHIYKSGSSSSSMRGHSSNTVVTELEAGDKIRVRATGNTSGLFDPTLSIVSMAEI